jgi:hypothetical protein
MPHPQLTFLPDEPPSFHCTVLVGRRAVERNRITSYKSLSTTLTRIFGFLVEMEQAGQGRWAGAETLTLRMHR